MRRNKLWAIGFCLASLLCCGVEVYAEEDTTVQSGGTTSAELADVLMDETGTGFVVFSDGPVFTGMVEVNSTTAGFLLPRMTTTQRDAIVSPVAGLFIYNTTTSMLNVYTTIWEEVGGVGAYTDEQAQDAIGAMLDTSLVYVDGTPLLQRAALTGDITASAGNNATTIAPDAVTNAKAANMAQSTMKGRAAGAGTGDPTDLTATQATAILDTVVADSGAGGVKGLAPATGAGDAAAGKFLKADATWAVPSVTLSGGVANKVAYWTSATVLSNDTDLHWDSTGNNLGIGVATFGATLHNGIAMAHDGTNFPTTNVTDTFQMYARDQAGSTNSSLFVKAEAGGITSVGTRIAIGNGGILLSNPVEIGGIQLDGAGPHLQMSNVASIAHGATGAGVATSTFFDIRPIVNTDGGVQMRGITETNLAMILSSVVVTDPVSTKTTTSEGALKFEFGKKFISTPEAMAAGVNLVSFSDAFAGGLGTRWILDNDGDTWQTGRLSSLGEDMRGSTSGTLSITPAATTTSHTLTMPATQGAASSCLQNNGSGALSWAACGTGSGDALVANPLSQFAATTSAQLAATLTNETGTGLAVFGTSPSFLGTITHTTSSGTARSIDVNYTRSGDQAGSATVAQAISSTFFYSGTNSLTPYHIMAEPLAVSVYYGDGTTPTVGSAVAGAFTIQVVSNGNEENEHAIFIGGLRYDIGTGYTQTTGPSGRGWMADFGMHGPIGVQPELFVGLVMFMNNYYNGSPDNGPSVGVTITTAPGLGTVQDALHTAATTYPLDVGLLVNGKSTGTGAGWTTGIRIGGTDGTWFGGISKTGTGLDISGYATRGIYLHGRHADGTAPAMIVAADAGPVVFGADAPNGSERFFITTATAEEVSRQKGTHATSTRFVFESTNTNEIVLLRTSQVNYILGITSGNNFVLSATDDHFASAHIMNITPGGVVGFGFGTTTPVGGGVLISSPTAQTIAAGNTITADACGSVKKITSAGAVTTSTVDTFSETWAGSSGCKMVVCNVGANAITLDNNARFVAGGITGAASGTDVVLGADDCVSVGSSGSKWYQVGAGSSNG